MRRLVAAAVDGHRVNPRLHRVLAEHNPHRAGAPNLDAFNAQAHALFQAFLDRHREQLQPLDTALAAFVCVTSIEGITHAAVVHRPDVLTDDALDALVDEATQLVLRYLVQLLVWDVARSFARGILAPKAGTEYVPGPPPSAG